MVEGATETTALRIPTHKAHPIVPADIIDGKTLARQHRERLRQQVTSFTAETQVTPKLVAVLVGEDPASQVYVGNKERACRTAGIHGEVIRLSAETTEPELLELITQLNQDTSLHGILVQLPLPPQLMATRVLDAVHPLKDVDGFHPENVGRLMQGRPRFLPCTPLGVLYLIAHAGVRLAAAHVVIVGRSDIVGKPLAMMCLQRSSPLGPELANATVTVCHSRSRDLAAITRQADVLIVAAGVPRLVTGDMIRPGAAVIDVGINRTEDGLVGDVEFESAVQVAGQLTPVPGGVGPMTIAMLLSNTLQAARLWCGG